MPIGGAHAFWGATDMLNTLLAFVAYLLQLIIIALGKLVLFLVDIVIHVAQYNTFTKAGPVVTGWPIVRDLINMFFIVILLISAFSTIIGYEKYHYSQIMKKFFLMAVLVNFSLPLFGLAIDFSQILMLTFVNGFRAAAAGNFVTILKLDQVMSIKKVDLSPDNGSNAIENPMVLKVTAMMFGIFILGISATILAIMVIYLVARIVGLWILLITSPGAMFVSGLPSSLQGKVKGLGGSWWDKLWGLLTGGPMMAFFLWLTLATAANIGPTFTDKTTSTYAGQGEVDEANNYFETAIGSVENFGTYIVAIVMLFEGLSVAVSSSAAIAPIAGKAAEKVRGFGVGTTKMLAYGGAAAGGAWAGRQVGGAVGEMGSGIDRRYGVTKGVGSMVQTVGIKTGWTGAAKVGATIAGTRGRAVKKKQEEFEEMTKGLSTGKRMDFAKQRMESLLSNKDEKRALSELRTKDAFSVAGQTHLLGQYDEEAKQKFGEMKEPDEKASDADKTKYKEYTQRVDAYKKQRLLGDRKKMLTEYQDAAGENEEKQRWIKEKKEATPSHVDDVMKFVSDKTSDDPLYFRKVKVDDFENVGVSMAVLAAAGFKGNELSDKDGVLATAMKGNDRKAQMLRATKRVLEEAADKEGGGMTVEEMIKNPDLLKKYKLSDATFVKDVGEPDGHRLVMGDAKLAPSTAGMNQSRDNDAIDAHRLAMEKARSEATRLESLPVGTQRDADLARAIAEVHRAQGDMLRAGESSEKVFRINVKGDIADPHDRASFASNIQNVFTEGKKDYKTYAKVDLGVLHQNTGGSNQARTMVVNHANVSDLSSAFSAASAAQDKTAMTNIADIVHAIEGEGRRHEAAIEYYNKNASAKGQPVIDTKEVAKAGQMYQQSQSDLGRKKATDMIQQALKGSGLIIHPDDAIAIAKHQEVLADTGLQHSAKQMSSRAKQAQKRGRQTT